jgi:SAM-dependent methyltransferase
MDYYNISDSEAYAQTKKKNKEIFYQVQKIIKKHHGKNTIPNILDVGCANGNLINFLEKEFPNSTFTGIDVSQKLISKCKKTDHKIFITSDYKKFSKLKKYDVVIGIGLSGYVSNLITLIQDLLKFVKKDGFLLVEGGVNFNGFDVNVKFRQNKSKPLKWETGFNSISSNYLENFLKKNKLKFKYFNWDFPIAIKYNKNVSKIRNRTFKDENGKFWIFNGLNFITHGPKTNNLNPTSSLMAIYKN